MCVMVEASDVALLLIYYYILHSWSIRCSAWRPVLQEYKVIYCLYIITYYIPVV